MGKIRVKTIGIEEDEKDQKKKAKLKAEAKRIEAAKKLGQETKAETAERQTVGSTKSEKKSEADSSIIEGVAKESSTTDKAAASSETPSNNEKKKPKVSKYKSVPKKQKHSTSYLAIASQLDKTKKYSLGVALKILTSSKRTKLDETVELHINTHEKGVSGNLTLPHGTGKTAKIEIADYASDPKHVEELVKKVTGGQVDFDILIATPETMSHLAKIARVLGPRGLMPNPKNGTISPKPKEAMKKFEGGQINFKTEAKFPIIHLSVGKISFEEKQLTDNIKAILQAIQAKNIKSVTLKSTMSPGIKIVI